MEPRSGHATERGVGQGLILARLTLERVAIEPIGRCRVEDDAGGLALPSAGPWRNAAAATAATANDEGLDLGVLLQRRPDDET